MSILDYHMRLMNDLKDGLSPSRFALAIMYPFSHIPRPEDFPETVMGLQRFLSCLGVTDYLSAREICRPHNEDVALDLGYTYLIPPKQSWNSVGVISLIHKRCRELAESPIYVRNCYRPADYNELVGGAPVSDHLCLDGCAAFDMDFVSPEAKQKCEEYIEDLYKKDYLKMSLGEGSQMYHIGVLSERGNRRWSY
jgi:hypothetical protein